MKTAVSIRKALSEQAEDLARKLKVSRIGLFALVLEDHIRRQQNQELLARINAAYTDEPDSAEHTLRRKARRTHRRIVEGKVKLNHTSPDLSPS